MNNSRLVIEDAEPEIDFTPKLRQRQAEVVEIITTLQKVSESDDWQVLKTLIFGGMVESLEKRLKAESEKTELNTAEIYRLNGQLSYARRYTDLNKLIDVHKTELNNLRIKLNANNRETRAES